jgi:hypothetical protein
MEEFYCFVWLALNDIPQLSTVKLPLKFLISKGVSIYDVKCFDKFIKLKKFLEGRNDNEELCNLLPHLKWVNLKIPHRWIATQNFLKLPSSFS